MARYPYATWRPTNKHGYPGNDTHLHQGLVIHSAEGSLAGLFSVLDGAREASWHFSVAQDGRVYQHIDTDHIAWTNGSQEANEKFWGIECEGGGPGSPGEPLTEPQYQALVDVVRWLWDTHGLGEFRREATLWEHREMTTYGAAATSCPSGRIPWTRLIADLEEDMPLNADDKLYLAGLMRGVVKALATGSTFNTSLRAGDADYTQAEHDLEDILGTVAAFSAGSPGGTTPDEIKEAVKEAQREGTG